ncbi:MAG: sortase, partial [Pygmaiobacter sp.]
EYDGYLFTYEYVETKVVKADDWSMMYCTEDYSAITLSSCHPMSTSEDRMCVRGRLLSITLLEGAVPLTAEEIHQGARSAA